MTDQLDHVKEFDPNAPKEAAPIALKPPERTPSKVMGEFFRALVKRLGNHPELEALLEEYEAMTAAPEIPPSPPVVEEPSV
jgi:hypothetical protein